MGRQIRPFISESRIQRVRGLGVRKSSGIGWYPSQVGGVAGGGAPAPLLLDSLSSAGAFSLRKLRTAYAGSCIRVRRSSDNTEQDIGFVSNALDESTLLTFCGAGNGFVTKWYDQSGNGRDKFHATTTVQPEIVVSGVVVSFDGKSTIGFPTGKGLSSANSSYLAANPISIFLVGASSAAGAGGTRRAIKGSVHNWLLGPYADNHTYYSNGAFLHGYNTAIPLADWSRTDNELFSLVQAAGTGAYSFRNGVTVLSSAGTTTQAPAGLDIGRSSGSESFIGYMAELIEFETDQRSNRGTIESNMAAYYGITI